MHVPLLGACTIEKSTDISELPKKLAYNTSCNVRMFETLFYSILNWNHLNKSTIELVVYILNTNTGTTIILYVPSK